ncbi:MAG: sodium/glutamate symporter [Acidobacteria bacterium]|nr:MAG: sodium/glutamate symporter [Acidobacteriota bacterium]
MEFTIVDGLRTLKFDLVLTLALAAVFLFVGGVMQQRISLLRRASIPAAAVGGLLFALIVLALRHWGALGVGLDTSLRAPLQTAFFTTIGLSATLALLRAGGWRMGVFWLIASALAVVQNVAGIGMARAVGAPAPLGIVCGSLTLTGGPATGLAFTSVFENLGLSGAGALIIASATFGIFVSNLVGNPVATALIRRLKLAQPQAATGRKQNEDEFWAIGAMGAAATTERDVSDAERAADELTSGELLRHLLLMLAVMGAGALLGLGLARLRLTLPGYIGAMIVAALVRNLAERFGLFRLNVRAIEALGAVALALFLVLALMDLKLWQLAGLALPLLAILGVQIVLTCAYAVLVTFMLMGRDYEAAVTTSGHIGFGLGITPNAIANMEALVERYGPAPRSFLVVPVVGAFFIDFSNALIITLFVNFVR